MAYSYKIFRDINLNYVKAAGSVHGKEILETAGRMFEDPDWVYVKRQITDFRNMTELILTSNDFDLLVRLEKEQKESQKKIQNGEMGKVAIIAQSEFYDIVFELYAFKTKDCCHETKLFNNLEDALIWLNESYNTCEGNYKLKDIFEDIKSL